LWRCSESGTASDEAGEILPPDQKPWLRIRCSIDRRGCQRRRRRRIYSHRYAQQHQRQYAPANDSCFPRFAYVWSVAVRSCSCKNVHDPARVLFRSGHVLCAWAPQPCRHGRFCKYTTTARFDGEGDSMRACDVFCDASLPLVDCSFGAAEVSLSNSSNARIARSSCNRSSRSRANSPCLTTIWPLLSQRIMFVIETPTRKKRTCYEFRTRLLMLPWPAFSARPTFFSLFPTDAFVPRG
jgi:hypothetical protein